MDSSRPLLIRDNPAIFWEDCEHVRRQCHARDIEFAADRHMGAVSLRFPTCAGPPILFLPLGSYTMKNAVPDLVVMLHSGLSGFS
jgi:hypothetical protein